MITPGLNVTLRKLTPLHHAAFSRIYIGADGKKETTSSEKDKDGIVAKMAGEEQ